MPYPYDDPNMLDEEPDASMFPYGRTVRNPFAGTAVAPPPMTSPTGAVPPPPAPPVEDYPEDDPAQFKGESLDHGPLGSPITAAQRYQQALQQKRPNSSLLSKIASGAMGAAAGYMNASGKRMAPINMQGIQNAAHNLQYGAYDRQMENLKAQVGIERQQKQDEMMALQKQAYGENIASLKQDRLDKATDREERRTLANTEEQRRSLEDQAKAGQFALNAAKAGAKQYSAPPPIQTSVPNGVMPGQDQPLTVGPPPDPDNLISNPFKPKQKFNPPPSDQEQKEATYREIPAPIAEALQIPPGTKVPPSELDSYIRAYETHQQKQASSPKQQMADRTTIADQTGLKGRDRQIYIATGRIERPPVTNVNMQAANEMDDDTIDFAARQYKQTGTMPSLGMGSAALRAKILKRAASLAKESGQSAEEVSANAAGFKGDQASLAQLKKQQNAVLAFERTALSNIDLANSISQKVDRSGSPLLNKYILYVKGQVGGDTETIKLKNAVATAASEYAKVISGSMGNTAVTDSLRKETENMLNAAFSKGTFNEVAQLMKTEMANRKAGYAGQIDELNQNLRGGKKAQPSNTPAVGTIKGGYRFKGGDPAQAANWEKVN